MCILLEYPSIKDYPVYDPNINSREQIFTLSENTFTETQSNFRLEQYYQFGQKMCKKNAELEYPKPDGFRLK